MAMIDTLIYRKRWEKPEWASLRKKIYYGLNSGKFPKAPLTEEGLLDWRGLSFPEDGRFNKSIFKNIDLSHCQTNYSWFTSCRFENILCIGADLNGFRDEKCYFNEVKFQNCSADAGLGIHVSEYHHVIFKEVDFRDCSFYAPQFYDCQFIDCMFNKVFFKASNFINTIFKGNLVECVFQGYYFLPEEEKKYGKAPRNQMLNVDFSEAELHLVAFRNNCPLTSIILPQDGKHYYFKYSLATITKMKEIIQKEWNGEARKEGMLYCDWMLTDANKQDDFVENIEDIYWFTGKKIGDCIFQLLVKVNQEIVKEKSH